jgi:hypothetical protein
VTRRTRETHVSELHDSDYFLSNAYINSSENEITRPTQKRVKQEPEDETIDGDKEYITEAGGPQLENCPHGFVL